MVSDDGLMHLPIELQYKRPLPKMGLRRSPRVKKTSVRQATS